MDPGESHHTTKLDRHFGMLGWREADVWSRCHVLRLEADKTPAHKPVFVYQQYVRLLPQDHSTRQPPKIQFQ